MRRARARSVGREAHAKLNVFLRVLGRREDGYHDLESLVLPISLADRVSVAAAERLSVEMAGAEHPAGHATAGGMNLALVAALALADACEHSGGAEIRIEKRIPVAAGLGGGSADAAATLVALNELWACGLEPAMLAEIGARIGSDVPACLAGEPVLMSGRGDLIAPAEVGRFHWVLVKFGFGVRSPDAYRWWDDDGAPTGPDPAALIDAAAAGDAEALGKLLFNDLEGPVFERHPQIGEAKGRLLAAGALGAVMSGSGSSVAGLARGDAHARELAGKIPGAIVTHGAGRDGGMKP